MLLLSSISVIRGKGRTEFDGESIPWTPHDLFTLPVGAAMHTADSDAALYWVHDQPLLTYLGVRADAPRFEPTLYKHEDEDRELKKIQSDPCAGSRSRVSVLLANKNFKQTETITHVLWAMYGSTAQRRNAVAAPAPVGGVGPDY